MSATAPLSAPPPPARTLSAGRVIAIVAGALIAFVAAGLLVAGGVGLWAHTTQRDADGWFTSPWHRFETPTRALTAESLRFGDIRGGPDDVIPNFGPIRVSARSADGKPVFVGIAHEAQVDTYLRDVAHSEVNELRAVGYIGTDRAGSRAPSAPEDATWSASASGPGTQTVRWDPESGNWAVVVMNADGSPGVNVDVRLGARANWVLPVALALLAAGLVLGAGAAALIAFGAGGAPRPPATAHAPAEAQAGEPVEPVTVTASLDDPPSRFLWLIKWLLLIPHAVILAFLWPALIVVTVVALVAIVATGRYPRPLFDFSVGVLRWTWRVGFYGSAALATDRYPPFTLARTDYPAELDVPYPERLSRWQPLVKPWLFALPHYLVLAAFFGWWNADATTWGYPGLLTVLVAIAAVLLAVRGRYPRDIFALIVGINRWALRVAAYALLLRDEYPPFRLDR